MERQLLPPRPGISVADVVARAGWIPSAGGTGPYLAFRARIPSINREDVDDRGIWEFDGDRIAARPFGKPPRGLDAAVDAMEQFIRDQLGDHKTYAFDTGATRARRVDFIRRSA